MIGQLIALMLLVALVVVAAALLSSKELSERLIAAGMLPRNFANFIPALQLVIRIFGVALMAAGVISLGIQSGWINRDTLFKYGFSGIAILIGLILLVMSPRKI